jgi:hypothetical protein
MTDPACLHDWVACGERNTRWAVVCTKCRKQDSVHFGRGRPRIDWDEFWRLVGRAPPAIKGRDFTGWKEPAVVDADYLEGPVIVGLVAVYVDGRPVTIAPEAKP